MNDLRDILGLMILTRGTRKMLLAELKELEMQRKQDERLKAQNKLLLEALMCLPGAMGATVTQEVCKICLRRGECEECLLDRAIREAMER
jgi:hypothetical protein